MDFRVLILFGLAVAGSGIYYIVTGKKKKSVCTENAEGTVVDFELKRTSNRTKYSKNLPVFTYTVNDFEHKRTHNNVLTKKKGDKIKVYYNPSNPEEYYIEEDKLISSPIFGIVCIIVGIGIIVFSFIREAAQR